MALRRLQAVSLAYWCLFFSTGYGVWSIITNLIIYDGSILHVGTSRPQQEPSWQCQRSPCGREQHSSLARYEKHPHLWVERGNVERKVAQKDAWRNTWSSKMTSFAWARIFFLFSWRKEWLSRRKGCSLPAFCTSPTKTKRGVANACPLSPFLTGQIIGPVSCACREDLPLHHFTTGILWFLEQFSL